MLTTKDTAPIDLRQEVQELTDAQNPKRLTLTAIAKACGFSVTVLSQWMAVKKDGVSSYRGNNAAVERSVRAFLERRHARSQAPKLEFPFTFTSAAQRFNEVAQIAHLDRCINVCIAAAGYGKTMAAKQYKRDNPDCVYIEADPAYTPIVLFKEICLNLGLSTGGTLDELKSRVIEKVKDTGWLLMVDQAEYLPARALDLTRVLHDKAGIGILLIGMPRLLDNLRGRNGDFAQLYSRVRRVAKLDPLDYEDFEALVTQVAPADEQVLAALHDACHGSGRDLSMILADSIRVAELNQVSITPQIVASLAKARRI
jgi:DNA transposition AAA+ family ATPase